MGNGLKQKQGKRKRGRNVFRLPLRVQKKKLGHSPDGKEKSRSCK